MNPILYIYFLLLYNIRIRFGLTYSDKTRHKIIFRIAKHISCPYLNWLKFSHFGCNPCQIENDDGSKSSSHLISFDKETFPISEDALGRVMEYQKEQFKQLIRLFGEDLR